MRTTQAGLRVAVLAAAMLGSASFFTAARAQQGIGGQVAGLPLTVTRVRWEELPSPAARLAKQVVGRQLNLTPADVPGLQAALYDLDDGQQLLLVQGGGYSGASATGFGIFIGGSRGFREAGSYGGSRSDGIPIALVPVRGGYPSLRVGMTEASPYNPRLSMAEQRYRVITHLLRYDASTGQYVDSSTGRR